MPCHAPEHRSLNQVVLLLFFIIIACAAGTAADARCERADLAARIAQARLNASHVLALYTACCGGRRLGSGAHLCPPAGTTAGRRGGRLLAARACDSVYLADQLVRQCEVGAKLLSPTCCAAVLHTIHDPDQDCLCTVSEKGDFLLSDLTLSFVWEAYHDCGGTGEAIPHDTMDCRHAPPPPPPPWRPRAKPSTTPPPRAHHSLRVSTPVVVGITVGLAMMIGGVAIAAFFSCRRPSSSSLEVEVFAPASTDCDVLLREDEERLPAAVPPAYQKVEVRGGSRSGHDDDPAPHGVAPSSPLPTTRVEERPCWAPVVPAPRPFPPLPVIPSPPVSTPPRVTRRRPRASWPGAGTEAASPPPRQSLVA